MDARLGPTAFVVDRAGCSSRAMRGHPIAGCFRSPTGLARELPTTGIDAQIATYAGRWPRAARAIDPVRLAAGEAHHRVYEIEVTGWVLFDEVHFADQPRRVVAAHRAPREALR